MANRRNSIKKIRTDKRKRLQNLNSRSSLHTYERRLNRFVEKKEIDQARDFSKLLFAKIDKAIGKGILKENTGNRKKSRIARRLNLLKA